MSTLWTPDGERPVSRDAGPAASDPSEAAAPPPLTPEQEQQAEAMARELAEARARLLETEVSTVLANHGFGIYELAAIHLTADDPDLEEARLAIDALTVLVEGLEGRLGEGEEPLKQALHQIKMAFVQRNSQVGSAPTES